MSRKEQKTAKGVRYQYLICFTMSCNPGEYQSETYFPLGEFRKMLTILEDAGVNCVKDIATQLVKTLDSSHIRKVFILCDDKKDIVDQAAEKLKKNCSSIDIKQVPWFPMHISELDYQANDVFSLSTTSSSDHPSSKDDKYKTRRDSMIDKYAKPYKHGEKLPRIEYTDEELKTWEIVYKRLVELWPKLAIKEHNRGFFGGLRKECCLSESSIPQLEDVSRFLKSRSGFILRPAAGLIRSRQFLAGFAFRVLHCNQPIRHKDRPEFSPEPDICHEILGHAALLSDPSFAKFLQEIGLASLGASDNDIKNLMRVYFYTIEFGLCKEDGETKALGAGLLSSYGELQHSCNKVTVVDFSASEAVDTKIVVTHYQQKYFMVNSLQDAKEELRKYAHSIEKPFKVDYDAATESVKITYL